MHTDLYFQKFPGKNLTLVSNMDDDGKDLVFAYSFDCHGAMLVPYQVSLDDELVKMISYTDFSTQFGSFLEDDTQTFIQIGCFYPNGIFTTQYMIIGSDGQLHMSKFNGTEELKSILDEFPGEEVSFFGNGFLCRVTGESGQ